MLQELLADLRFGFRKMAGSLGITLAMLLVLAVGISVNATLFSVFYGVLVKPLPYPQGDRLAVIWAANRQSPQSNGMITLAEWEALQDEDGLFAAVACFKPGRAAIHGTPPETVAALEVSDNFLSVLGLEPLIGRALQKDEQTALLSSEYWASRMGGEETAPGRSLLVDGEAYSVSGVLPPNLHIPYSDPQVWIPLRQTGLLQADFRRRQPNCIALARLMPGLSWSAARGRVESAAERIRQAYGGIQPGFLLRLAPLREQLFGSQRPALGLLQVGAFLLLLIVCSNIAGLTFSRSRQRSKEFAIRASLGAARSRLSRQVITETLLSASLAGLLALILSPPALKLLIALMPADLPRRGEISFDWLSAGVLLAVTLLAGLIISLMLTWRSSRTDLIHQLKDGPRRDSKPSGRASSWLVGAQVALATVLLLAAGLLSRSFFNLEDRDLGFRPDAAFAARISPAPQRYPEASQRQAFFDRLLERVQSLPGVRKAALATSVPLIGSRSRFPVSAEEDADLQAASYLQLVDHGYFEAMDIRLLRGRLWQASATGQSPPPVVISQSLQRRLSLSPSAVGRMIKIGGELRTVIGVVEDVHSGLLEQASDPVSYAPLREGQARYLVLRSDQPLSVVAAEVRALVQQMDEDQPVDRIDSFAQVIDDRLAGRRFATSLVLAFAFLSLLLSLVGSYGLVAYSVQSRARELAVRAALGAQPGELMRWSLAQGFVPVVVGIGAGGLAGHSFMRWLSSLLYQVLPTDGLTYAGVALLMGLAGLLACYLPTRRASRLDPALLLRTS